MIHGSHRGPDPCPAPLRGPFAGSGDFPHLKRLEQEIWSGDGAGMLCPHYLRLCTDFYSEWCFLALDGDRPVGYVLNFPRGR